MSRNTTPTRFVTDPKALPPYRELSMAMPAPDMVKAGWRMLWLGLWCAVRRRDLSIDIGWTERA